MEVIWKAGHYEEDDLFTGVLYNYYSPPPSFCWELLCNDEPIMDNPELHDYNLDRRARDFVEYAKNANKAYRTNHVAITTGMDFHYQVKFMFSKKATKITESSLSNWRLLSKCQIDGEDFVIFCGILRKHKLYNHITL